MSANKSQFINQHTGKSQQLYTLRQGYVLPDGVTVVLKEKLEDLHQDRAKLVQEFATVWKLTDLHLTCRGSARQRVYLATELGRNSVHLIISQKS